MSQSQKQVALVNMAGGSHIAFVPYEGDVPEAAEAVKRFLVSYFTKEGGHGEHAEESVRRIMAGVAANPEEDFWGVETHFDENGILHAYVDMSLGHLQKDVLDVQDKYAPDGWWLDE